MFSFLKNCYTYINMNIKTDMDWDTDMDMDYDHVHVHVTVHVCLYVLVNLHLGHFSMFADSTLAYFFRRSVTFDVQ